MLTDPLVRGVYSTDASMYQMLPLDVVVPVNRDDLLIAIRQCANLGQPLLARGAGTSLTGQSIGEAVILDTSKYLNKVLELNLEEAWVRVEPGLVCSELNSFLKPYGVRCAPDPATENRATIGGMIANNAAGMRSVRYGMTIDHVLDIEVGLARGEELHLTTLSASELALKSLQSDREGEIYRGVSDLLHLHGDKIRERFPKVIRQY